MKHHQTCVSWLHYNTFRERFPDHQVRGTVYFVGTRQTFLPVVPYGSRDRCWTKLLSVPSWPQKPPAQRY